MVILWCFRIFYRWKTGDFMISWLLKLQSWWFMAIYWWFDHHEVYPGDLIEVEWDADRRSGLLRLVGKSALHGRVNWVKIHHISQYIYMIYIYIPFHCLSFDPKNLRRKLSIYQYIYIYVISMGESESHSCVPQISLQTIVCPQLDGWLSFSIGYKSIWTNSCHHHGRHGNNK